MMRAPWGGRLLKMPVPQSLAELCHGATPATGSMRSRATPAPAAASQPGHEGSHTRRGRWHTRCRRGGRPPPPQSRSAGLAGKGPAEGQGAEARGAGEASRPDVGRGGAGLARARQGTAGGRPGQGTAGSRLASQPACLPEQLLVSIPMLSQQAHLKHRRLATASCLLNPPASTTTHPRDVGPPTQWH